MIHYHGTPIRPRTIRGGHAMTFDPKQLLAEVTEDLADTMRQIHALTENAYHLTALMVQLESLCARQPGTEPESEATR